MKRSLLPHAFSAEEVLASLGANGFRGLDDARVEALRVWHGRNELAAQPPAPLWRKLLRQFNAVVIWVLVAAAVVSALLGEKADAAAILAIVVLNGLLGFAQEEKAERSLAALRKLSAPAAKVLRDGEAKTIPAVDLVPGDLVELEAGDQVPADARLLEAFNLRVQEAALTGESHAVKKDASALLDPKTALADRRNCAFMGTIVAAGKASAVVVATGMATEIGRIAGMLQRHEPEPTPLQQRLAQMGKALAIGCLALVALVFAVELLRGGRLLEVFLLSVSLAVAAVPEGLPAVVTVALALGLQRMVKRNALIRRLPSVETLGSVTVICSDKTGTLTRNEMTVRELDLAGRRYRLKGAETLDPRTFPDLRRALQIGVVCNNARLRPRVDGGGWDVIGDPTEGALLIAGYDAGIAGGDRPVYQIAFDSERKAMSVVTNGRSGLVTMHTKGAPEVIVEKCSGELRDGEIVPLTGVRRGEILAAAREMASRALRVLGLAFREQPGKDPAGVYAERELVFAGLVGMIDPPREEASEAVARCRGAGIRPVMITGDHPDTARAIAREIGILGEGDRLLTGVELDALSDDALAAQVERIAVYARVSAEHKLRVVRAWKSRGHVVAMTGDGVNDAPAVRAADIGIAMGVSGTDVTREASAMVLTDDNFASIVHAVEEGRGIYDNIQKVLRYLLSCNAGEILFVLVASLLGWPLPILPLQLLWINLVTDGLPALALSLEPAEDGAMSRPPRPPSERLLSGRVGLVLLGQGALIGAAALAAFAVHYLPHPHMLERARTMAFCVLVFSQLFVALTARSWRVPLARLGLFSNPAMLGALAISALLQVSVVTVPWEMPLFESAKHYAWEWVDVLLFAAAPALVIELVKWIGNSWRARRRPEPGRPSELVRKLARAHGG